MNVLLAAMLYVAPNALPVNGPMLADSKSQVVAPARSVRVAGLFSRRSNSRRAARGNYFKASDSSVTYTEPVSSTSNGHSVTPTAAKNEAGAKSASAETTAKPAAKAEESTWSVSDCPQCNRRRR